MDEFEKEEIEQKIGKMLVQHREQMNALKDMMATLIAITGMPHECNLIMMTEMLGSGISCTTERENLENNISEIQRALAHQARTCFELNEQHQGALN
jgi:flagellar biosynthesis component FlhA